MENEQPSTQSRHEGSLASLTGNLHVQNASDATPPPKVRKGKSLLDNTSLVNYGRGGYNKDVQGQDKKRGVSEGGWDKTMPPTEILEDQAISTVAFAAYRDMDFELAGIWDGGPSQQYAEYADTATEDYIVVDITERPRQIAHSITLNTDTQSASTLDWFLNDTDPWSEYSTRMIQTKDSMSKPRHPPSPPSRHAM